MKKVFLLIASLILPLAAYSQGDAKPAKFPFNDVNLSFEQRVDDLLSRLTAEEKVMQMMNFAPAIERLGIPKYNWWNECLHGVGRSGDRVTVFPQAIGLAATWDREATRKMADITATEGRAIYNGAYGSQLQGNMYKGLTYWTPNINIFRDPRWGRGQETYGEDPYLTGEIGTSFVRGLQGDDPKYLKASACAKHYAVHSGPEPSRHVFDAHATDYDLWDTYLAAFRTLVEDADVSAVMCAYNRYDGEPCCGSTLLMLDILRDKWGFDGYVTSDCGAIDDFFNFHKTHPDGKSAAADAVQHGTDVDCGSVYAKLVDAMAAGLITEEQIDVSLRRLMMTRMKLGLFDPQDKAPFSDIPYSRLEAGEHREHALEMARKSMVLLKNDGVLPLSKNLGKVAVIGPNADDEYVMFGNYNGFPSKAYTVFDGVKEKIKGAVTNFKGLNHTMLINGGPSPKEIANMVSDAEVIVFVGGISPRLEGEEGDAGNENIEGFKGGDRTSIMLPAIQTEVMKELKKLGKPIVFVNMSGSAIAMPWEAENVNAIIQAWYGGQSAGTAVADIMFGDYNPSGRLPLTFYRSDSDLPDFNDYSMKGRTYRYFEGQPLFPFGYGLSFTEYSYSDLQIPESIKAGEPVAVSVQVQNTGKMAGEEVVQVYLTHNTKAEKPIRALRGFERVSLAPGEKQTVRIELTPRDLALVNNAGEVMVDSGKIDVYVGGGQPDEMTPSNVLTAKLAVKGKSVKID